MAQVLSAGLRFLSRLAAFDCDLREPTTALPAATRALVTHARDPSVAQAAAGLMALVGPGAGASGAGRRVWAAILGALDQHGPSGTAPGAAHALLACVSSLAFHGCVADLSLSRAVPLVMATSEVHVTVGPVVGMGLTCLGNLAAVPGSFGECVCQ
jgi:hypothetical protein